MIRTKTVVFFSNSFPNDRQPHRGVFVEQRVAAASRKVNPVIVCPLPWVPKIGLLKKYPSHYLFALIPREYDYHGFHVYSPKYPVVPKVPWLSPWSMALGAYPVFRKLKSREHIDVINAQNAFPEGVAAVWLGKMLDLPVVISALGSDINEAHQDRLRLRMTVNALQQARQVTAVSRRLKQKIIDMGIEPGRVHYIPNGVDAELFNPAERSACRKELGIDDRKKVLLFVGKFRPVKGIEYLLDALRILKGRNKLDFDTLLVGSGPLEPKYRLAIESWGLNDHVVFAGNRRHEEIGTWMGAADLFCLPSLKEGMPNVVLEALACGCPVVASNVGGIPDMIKSGTGILVPAADSSALADALEKGFLSRWDAGFIRESIRNMTWENTAAGYVEAFSRLNP